MRVLSYNIHKGIGGRDRRYRLERIIEVIRHEEPDFVCLQEVDHNVRRSRHHDQPQRLAEELSYPYRLYQLNVKVQTGGYGNLLLSRWPFQEQHQVSLTLHQRKPRAAQWVVIATPSGPFRLLNWHLGLVELERHWQVRRLLEHHRFRNQLDLPTMLIGDTNDWRNTLVSGPFAVHSYRQVSEPVHLFRSFPAYMPLGALDKVFISNGIEIVKARIVRNRQTAVASDHLPLVVDFHLPPRLPRQSLPVSPT